MIPPRRDGWTDVAVSEWDWCAPVGRTTTPTRRRTSCSTAACMSSAKASPWSQGPETRCRCPPDRAGRYWAPEYARMLAVYGPNPAAEESDLVDNRRVAGDLRPPAGHVRFPRPWWPCREGIDEGRLTTDRRCVLGW